MANCSRLALFLLALCVAPFSYGGVETLFDRHGFAIYPASNAVSVQTTAPISAVASNGTRAVVPVTAAVNVSKATMALNAAKLARSLSPIGAAFTAYAIYDAVKASGVTTCAPPDFFCMPGSAPVYPGSYPNCYLAAGGTVGGNPSQCATAQTDFGTLVWVRGSPAHSSMQGTYQCVHKASASWEFPAYGFDCSGSAAKAVAPPTTPGGAFASDQALADAMAANDWNGAVSKKIWDGVQADMSKAPGTLTFKDTLGAQSPVTVSGSPVTTPQVTTSSKTTPNPDGSTSTEVQKEQTTFTPGKDGSTVADAVPKVSQSTVITTTTTNNTTNVTNTTTTTQTPPKSAEEERSDLCKDNPDIVACKKLGTLEATPVPNVDKPVSITSDTGWGASNGACPAPGSFTAMGKTIPVPWDVFCQFAQGIRPFLIAVAYIIAVGGFIGLSRKD